MMGETTSLVQSIASITFPDLLFIALSAIAVGCGFIVVYSRNILHSGFALLGTFAGVAGLYGLLSANFLMAVQILVYVGGILVVILFAVMLTRSIENVEHSNPSKGIIPATLAGLLITGSLIFIAVEYPWKVQPLAIQNSTVSSIGNELLGAYLIPFELLSVVLLAALIGAVMLVRKEIKNGESDEKEAEL
jgi:NADH:ubiquinone oxidoreductase subunit 6 (subunit J)